MVNLPDMVHDPPSSPTSSPSGPVQNGAQIPNHFIFVWYGSRLPAFASIAIRSALTSNPGSTATLLHDDTFKPNTEVWSLESRGLVCERISIETLLTQAQAIAPSLDVDALYAVYRQLTAPAARSNLVRILALYCQGGVYLDTDTLTIRDLAPLRDSGAFCGQERVLWPAGRRKTSLKAITLGEVRRLCAAIPYAYRANQRLFSHYSLAENNAVMGARRGHPFLLHLLEGVLSVPKNRITKRFILGTHLLQQQLASFQPAHEQDTVIVLPPDYFYPVGPMISRHYFAHYASARKVADELLTPNTFVIHWYASVAQLDKRDHNFILKNAEHEVFSCLCREFLTEQGAGPRPVALHVHALDPERPSKDDQRSKRSN
jgi:hypothetical protein